MASATKLALENLPPPGPPTPMKSVSQNRQIALDRSFSRPDQRLHPENRQNTAARQCRILPLARYKKSPSLSKSLGKRFDLSISAWVGQSVLLKSLQAE